MTGRGLPRDVVRAAMKGWQGRFPWADGGGGERVIVYEVEGTVGVPVGLRVRWHHQWEIVLAGRSGRGEVVGGISGDVGGWAFVRVHGLEREGEGEGERRWGHQWDGIGVGDGGGGVGSQRKKGKWRWGWTMVYAWLSGR